MGFAQCDDDTALDKMLIVGIGNADVTPTLVEELSEAAVGADVVESSMCSGAVPAAGATVSVVVVDDVEVDG